MSVIAFVPNAQNVGLVVEWARTFKENGDKVHYICYDDAVETALRSYFEKRGITDPQITTTAAVAPVNEVLEICRKRKPRALVTSSFSFPDAAGRPQTSTELVRAAPCMTIAPLYGKKGPSKVKRLLTVVNPERQGIALLRMADMLRKKLHAKVTIATVERESGAKAERAGHKAVQSMLNDAGLDEDDFEVTVAVDRLKHRGVLRCFDNHDAIVGYLSNVKDISPLRQSVGDATLIVVKRSPPVRLKSFVEWLPQINPRDHAELLQDLRSGSQWNRDFVSMLALASAIASLGLMQNSPAVVIGSMLLAPMMTPMIGAGLALAQANVSLARQCGRTIILGILLTLAVSFLLGIITPSRETLSPEILSRGEPNVLDLLIALFAAIAATIAMSRPNISGAVAGVAIATALVPPLCAVGLSLSNGAFPNALGAWVLFCTNLVAIVVASTFTFTSLGIVAVRGPRRYQKRVLVEKFFLVVVLAILAGPLSKGLLEQLQQGRNQAAIFPVTRAVARALKAHVDKDPSTAITMLGRSSVADGVIIHIASRRELPEAYANELRAIVRREMGRPDLKVYVVCLNGQWLNLDDWSGPLEQSDQL